jgi:hypothetical protein
MTLFIISKQKKCTDYIEALDEVGASAKTNWTLAIVLSVLGGMIVLVGCIFAIRHHKIEKVPVNEEKRPSSVVASSGNLSPRVHPEPEIHKRSPGSRRKPSENPSLRPRSSENPSLRPRSSGNPSLRPRNSDNPSSQSRSFENPSSISSPRIQSRVPPPRSR